MSLFYTYVRHKCKQLPSTEFIRSLPQQHPQLTIMEFKQEEAVPDGDDFDISCAPCGRWFHQKTTAADFGSNFAVVATAAGLQAGQRAKGLARLQVFYHTYNPAKLEDPEWAANTIDRYAGNIEGLFEKLREKYGPEPVSIPLAVGCSSEEVLVLQALASTIQPWASLGARKPISDDGLSGSTSAFALTRALVLARLQRVRRLFPSASAADLQAALLSYSPESALFAQGHQSTEPAPGTAQADKYQGRLFYGSDQAFFNGAAAVLGTQADGDGAVGVIMREILEHGEDSDRYNLWYVRFCAGVEQHNYNENGELRLHNGTPKAKLDEGHGGMLLADFTAVINGQLAQYGSSNRVSHAQVLALRLYTTSTFRRLNSALRDKGMGKVEGDLGFKACIQSARKCLLVMQAIPRPKASTFRGISGYLPADFATMVMGMDYSFISASTDESVGVEFSGSVDHSVLFEVEYQRACPGVDVAILSLFPGEKEVLFPPCTGLSLPAGDGAAAFTGLGAGQARVKVFPTAAAT